MQTNNKTPNQKWFTSSCREIQFRVPQVPVLAPLLFLLYVNDLQLNVQEAKVVLFAGINTLVIDKDHNSLQEKR